MVFTKYIKCQRHQNHIHSLRILNCRRSACLILAEMQFTEIQLFPNTEEYYYMFRKINTKGLASNPSPIYKVKLLKDADDSKLIISEYDIPEKIKKSTNKEFQKFISDIPSD